MVLNDFYEKDFGEIRYINGTEEFSFETPDHEEGFFMIIRNDGGLNTNVRIKAGNSIYAMGDLTVMVESNATVIINLKNTGRFKNVNGENSGKILGEILDGDASALSMAIISL